VKGYRPFFIVFTILLVIYILAEMNRPKELKWDISLSKEDKNPYGGFVLFKQLRDIFPTADIRSFRLPVYNQINNYVGSNTAYLLIEPGLALTQDDIDEMLNYVDEGNYVFMSSISFNKALMDTLMFNTKRHFDVVGDSATINFTSPSLHTPKNIGFNRLTLDGYFDSLDSSRSIILGNNQRDEANFIKIPHGEGAFFVHAAPLCFSNYFMLKNDNAGYTAKALSYLPREVKTIYWDEYYKMGPEGSHNPLRFILTNPYLKWAYRIGLVGMLLFVLFEMKRKQRVIPIITPLRNTTLDFVQTVGNVYFNKRDNRNIAIKKINYFLEFVRSNFYLSTSALNEEFIQLLAKKTGAHEQEITRLVNLINEVNTSFQISDGVLLELGRQIDSFYAKAK
jgi:hypothetical protein